MAKNNLASARSVPLHPPAFILQSVAALRDFAPDGRAGAARRRCA
jgi:hypothetical protein